MSDVRDRVLDVIATDMGISRDSLSDECSMDALGADEIDTLSISFQIEDKFSFEVEDIDSFIERSTTIAEIVQKVTAHIGGQNV